MENQIQKAKQFLKASGLKRYETRDRPEEMGNLTNITVSSEKGFTVYLNNLPVQARKLEIEHPEPLTAYGIQGFRKTTYSTPRDTISPRAEATEVELSDPETTGAVFEVTSFEKMKEQGLLGLKQEAQIVYKDPRVTRVDGREFQNLDTIKVEGLKDGKVVLSLNG